MLATSVVTGILLLVFKVPLVPSLLLAIGFCLSSTAVVSKLLQENGDESSLAGQLAIGILIFQDIASIPTIVLLSSLDGSQVGFLPIISTMALVLVKSVLIIGLLIFIGVKVIPYIFEKLGKLSRELMNLFVVLFIIGCVALFTVLGLSSALAAFVAGLLISQTSQHYHVFSQVRPLRDIFVILFFVFLGASTQLALLVSQLPLILMFSIVIMIIKIAILYGVFVKFHFHTKVSFTLGILLSQVGEFAFLLFKIGEGSGLITSELVTFATGVTLVTLIICPFIISKKDTLYLSLYRFFRKVTPDLERYVHSLADADRGRWEKIVHKDHVIICGYGRVGSYIGRALKMAEIPYIAIDYNYFTVSEARQQGESILYGDPTDPEILAQAHIAHASALISAVPDMFSQEAILIGAKKANKDIVIFSRIRHENEQKRLKDLGAEVVVHPEFEAALSIVKKILVTKHVGKDEIVGKIQRLKIEHGMG